MSDTGFTTENKYFDQHFCGKVMRVGAIACAATLVGNVLFLALVDPLHSHCAGSIQKLSSGGSIWESVNAHPDPRAVFAPTMPDFRRVKHCCHAHSILHVRMLADCAAGSP